MKLTLKEKNRIGKSGGFTIIELLVVISIMATITGLFLVNFAGLRGPRNLKIAQNEMVTNFRKIQSYTLSSRDVDTTNAARYYILKAVQGNNFYTIQAVGVNKTTGVQFGSLIDVETIRMPTGVTISAIGITNASGTAINPAPGCVQTGFSLPFSKIYLEYQTDPTSCNFLNVISNSSTLDAKANHTLTLTLKDAASNTTKQVVVRGVTGAIISQ